MVRINKYLATCEIGSRRSVEALIKEGKVSINDIIVHDLSMKIDPNKDIVKVNDKKVNNNPQKLFIMLNKPKGYIVTKNDEFNRKTIYNLLPEFASKLHPIGRLDNDSEGLILLTNDGDITNKIIHPSSQVEKTYKVIIKGNIPMENIQKLRSGIDIDGSPNNLNNKRKINYTTQPAKVFLNNSSDEKSEIRIAIKEGKNRQIRKMFEALGHQITTLKRLQVGQIKLEKLPTGMWRFLKDNEILYLLKLSHGKQHPFPSSGGVRGGQQNKHKRDKQ